MFGRSPEEPSPQSLVGTTGATIAPAEPEPTGAGEGPLLALFLVLTLAASAFVLWRSEHAAVHDPKEKAARGEITGLDSQSLLRSANLKRALMKIGQGSHPLVSNLRVAPGRVNAGVRDRDGYRRSLTIDPGFGVQSDDAGVGEDYAVRASGLDAAAPERMMRAVLRKTGMPASAVDYATIALSSIGSRNWYLFLDQGPARVRQWMAEPDGSDVRRPGEPSTAQKRATAREKAAFQRQFRHTRVMLARRTACLSKAHDAAAVSRCLERYQP